MQPDSREYELSPALTDELVRDLVGLILEVVRNRTSWAKVDTVYAGILPLPSREAIATLMLRRSPPIPRRMPRPISFLRMRPQQDTFVSLDMRSDADFELLKLVCPYSIDVAVFDVDGSVEVINSTDGASPSTAVLRLSELERVERLIVARGLSLSDVFV